MAARRRTISLLRRSLRPALLVAAMSAAAGSAATVSTASADQSTRETSTDATLVVAAPDGWHRSTDPLSDSPVTGSTSNVRLPAVIFAAGVLVIVLGVRNARQGA
jgi:hypothetical protein